MGRFTREERRRIFLAQERARQTMLAWMSTARAVDIDRDAGGRRGLRRVVKTAMILTMFAGGLAAYQFIDFHSPTSLVEALLPRP